MSTEQLNLESFARLNRPAGGDLQSLRESGMQRFLQAGLPTDKDEEWRFTNTDPLAEVAWQLPTSELDASELLKQHSLAAACTAELVLVNGRLNRTQSKVGDLPRGLTAGLLSELPPEVAGKARAQLATLVGVDKTPFAALNAGFLDQIVVVHAARATEVVRPIHVLSLSTTAGTPLLLSPRILVIADNASVVRVVETHAGNATDAAFSNAVTEVFVGRDATVEHYQSNWTSYTTYAIGNTVARIDANGRYTNHNVSLGGRLVRNDLEAILNGRHADATLNGLLIAGQDRLMDNHTLIRHEKPDCTSRELYKHVVGDKAFGVFKGKIFVQKDAQHTDSKQTNRTLLLTDQAMMESMPALEIYADDVKCTHGSTTGPLDEDMLFYLKSRGLSTDAARHLLIYAFAADMTGRMKFSPARQKIEQYLAAQQDLPQDLSIEAS